MSVWDVCIRRPIFTAMLVSAPIVLGLASYARLGVDLFPKADPATVNVKEERVFHWMSNGALPTESVGQVFKSAGLLEMFYRQR